MTDAVNYNEAGIPIKYTDNGDGTFSESVSIAGGGGGGGTVTTIDKFNINNAVDASATVSYVGLESAAGEWCVRKIDTTSGVNIQYATALNNEETATYATAWTNRATLTYNDYSGAF